MFLGHVAVGFVAKRAEPRISLATWFADVQLVDLIWPIMLLAGWEHVRIARSKSAQGSGLKEEHRDLSRATMNSRFVLEP